MRKLMALALAVLGLLTVTAGLAGTLLVAQETGRPDAGGPGAHREAIRPLVADATSARILLGVGDAEPVDWSGEVALDHGEVLGVEPWRIRGEDPIQGRASWSARSLIATKGAQVKKAQNKNQGQNQTKKKAAGQGKNAAKKAARKAANDAGQSINVAPAGVIVRVKAPADATILLKTAQGEVRVPLAELAAGAPRRYLNGRLEVQLVPSHAPLATTDAQEDFPAATPDGKSGAWVAYVDHQARGPVALSALREVPESFKDFVPTGGGDQIKVIHFNGSEVDRRLDVTEPGRDVWRPSIAVDGQGNVVVAWPEFVDGNWDIYARTFKPADNSWGETQRLTTDPGSDSDPALGVSKGKVHVAWQAWRGGQADIHLMPVDDPTRVANLSDHPANEWSPAIAAGSDGKLAVAFDTYRDGNYDVMVATMAPGMGAPKLVAVANTPKFEVRPTLGVDRSGRIWVAYEERSVNWGKDFGVHDKIGSALYQNGSAVRVRCVDGDRVLDGGDPVSAGPDTVTRFNSYPRLAVDGAGRPRLLFRHRMENNWRGATVAVVGAVWSEYATALVGKEWKPPQPLPRSDNLLDNRPALAVTPDGPVLAFYSTDARLHRESAGQGQAQAIRKAADAPARRWVNNDLFVASLTEAAGQADASPGEPAAKGREAPAVVHRDETGDLARIRGQRIEAGGKTYQLLRGEFHRHTEISPDGGNDGSLEDMWRYAIDAGALDWVGCGDHDNGNGREYTWWLTQKTTDLYKNAPTFTPMFTYERSVVYPGGHRNVMFPVRGIRTLPRLVDDGGPRTNVKGVDEDAQMLYKYLHEMNGICASHTSGTTMGTDWRANDPAVEPFVEIYQGDRDSYEHLGAPRAAHNPNDAAGGWRPLGMVWNALAMQYKLGFQASSDHISTHISYAVALAEAPTREAIFDAFKQRHCYGATDNIVLNVQSGQHMMGDEFTANGPITLKVFAHGTGPIKRIDVIKDFHYVFSTEPKADKVEFNWTDEEGINRNPSWYYVRVLQEDGEIAWGSPMWVRKGPAAE